MPAGREGSRVLLVGCGQLGSRHLQALISVPDVREIEVVDINPEALALGRQRLADITDHRVSTSVRWLSSLEEASHGGALCLVATHAQGRCELIRQVADALGYSAFLLEKIVSPSIEEYEALLEFSARNGLSAWVNCQARGHPFHQAVKARLDPTEPVFFSVMGGNHGLATNGLHAADLFAFYDGSGPIEGAGSSIDPILHPSKRGKGLYDLSGTVRGTTAKGSQFTLSYAADHAHYEHFTIATRSYRCLVDQVQGWAVETDAAAGWAWHEVPFGPDMRVSRMTQLFASDILRSGRCDLPTLEDGFVAHRFILEELGPHFQTLLNTEEAQCPVT